MNTLDLSHSWQVKVWENKRLWAGKGHGAGRKGHGAGEKGMALGKRGMARRHAKRGWGKHYHSRLVYDQTRTILAILYGEVPHMLPAKYQPNPPGGSGEEDF